MAVSSTHIEPSTPSNSIKRWVSDIRLWIVLLFLIRLVGITNPPLETGHNWRQSLTNMIARNFHENGLDLLHPTVDMGGTRTGIIGSEFPLFNAMISTTADVFGYEHWCGRLINLIFSSIGLYFFFLIVSILYSSKAAFYGTLVLGVSIWFAFSRKIMPDTFSISLMMGGIYFGLLYLKNGKYFWLILYLILTCLGVLSKIPALYLFAPILVVLMHSSLGIKRRFWLGFASLTSFSIAALWYFYWVPELVDTYHYQLYFTRGLSEGWHLILPQWPLLLEKFYFSALHSFVAFAAVLFGLFLLIREKRTWLLWGLFSSALVFFLFVLKTGETFVVHNYYVIPFVPVFAFLAGVALSKIPKKLAIPLMCLIVLEGIGNQNHDFFLTKEVYPTMALEKNTKKYLPDPNAKIIINGGESPTEMYFAHRKGWSVDNPFLFNLSRIDSLKRLGAKYLIIHQSEETPETLPYPILFDNDHYKFYDLSQK